MRVGEERENVERGDGEGWVGVLRKGGRQWDEREWVGEGG